MSISLVAYLQSTKIFIKSALSQFFIAALTFCIVIPSARAEPDNDVFWQGSGWIVSALYGKEKFGGCSATIKYSDGLSMAILLLPYTAWTIALDGNNEIRGRYQMYIDGQIKHDGYINNSHGLTDLGLLPRDILSAISEGHKLTIVYGSQRLNLSLAGSADALDQAYKCNETAIAAEQGLQLQPRASGDEMEFIVARNVGGYANLRKGPGLQWPIVTQIPEGARGLKRTGPCVKSDEESEYRWCPIAWNGMAGLVSTSNLIADTTASEPSKIPVVPPKQSGATAGTGFFVSREGHILTNAHVVSDCASIAIMPVGGQLYPVQQIASDRTNDLALLKSSQPQDFFAQSFSVVRLGAQVFVYGFPLTQLLSESGTFTVGNVNAESGLHDNSTQFQISAAVQPGNSGGPVLDAYGNIVGVVVSKLDAIATARMTGDIPQNVNFGIRASAAATFLVSKGIAVGEPIANAKALDSAEIADHARKFTVHIRCERRE